MDNIAPLLVKFAQDGLDDRESILLFSSLLRGDLVWKLSKKLKDEATRLIADGYLLGSGKLTNKGRIIIESIDIKNP